jgi:hypothetical protein
MAGRAGMGRGPSNPRGHAARQNPSSAKGLTDASAFSGGAKAQGLGAHGDTERAVNVVGSTEGSTPLDGRRGTTPKSAVDATMAAAAAAANTTPGGVDPLSKVKLPTSNTKGR